MNAQDLEQRARELLAAEYEREGSYQAAGKLRDQSLPMMWWSDELALRAIAAALRQQPVVDDARMARALEWVRDAAEGDAGYREYLPVVEEVFAAYNPSCGGRTVPVVDAAMVGRACDAYLSNRLGGRSVSHSAMRDALTAALARAQGVQS